MADTHPSPADAGPETIRVDQKTELQAWAKKLDATPEQIREAVAAVGNRAADVEMHLKGTHATTNADQQEKADRSGGSA